MIKQGIELPVIISNQTLAAAKSKHPVIRNKMGQVESPSSASAALTPANEQILKNIVRSGGTLPNVINNQTIAAAGNKSQTKKNPVPTFSKKSKL